MAWLDNDPDLKFWYAKYRDAEGREHSCSTKVPKEPPGVPPADLATERANNKHLAQTIANDLEATARGFMSEEEFAAHMHLTAKRATRQTSDVKTNFFLVAWVWERAFRNSTGPHKTGQACNLVDALLTFLGDKARKRLKQLRKSDFTAFIRERRLSNYAASVVNWEVVYLRAIARAAQPHTGVNLAADLEKEAKDSERRTPFTVEEVTKIIQTLHILGELGCEWKTVILLILYTSMRPDDACRLTRGNIDLEAGLITYAPGKNKKYGRAITITMHKVLWEYLKQLLTQSPLPPAAQLCPNLARRAPASRAKSYRRVLVAAGIPPLLVERADRKVRFHRHTLYALRHTFSTWYRAAGANKEERKKAMGHTTDEAHEYYQHDQDPAILEAQRKLINLLPCVPVTWTTEASKSL